MHKRDSWAAVNSQVTKGRRPRKWMAFLDCLELHKLTVFSADAAKRQQFYIQQAVRKPQRATVQQHILRMGVLNDCKTDQDYLIPQLTTRRHWKPESFSVQVICMATDATVTGPCKLPQLTKRRHWKPESFSVQVICTATDATVRGPRKCSHNSVDDKHCWP
jgi:hypothetical protein